jgi:predicted nucleic acid-binding protein
METNRNNINNKRKEYLDQVGEAIRVIYSIIHLVPEKYRDKLRDTYSILVQIYSET